jgi:sodium/potassium-transporting ATPase subunit alpha
VDEVLEHLSVSPSQGLSSDQVARKLKDVGRNVLTSPPSRWFRKTISYLFGGFGSILFVASILVFIAWKPLGSPPAVANLALAIVLAIVWIIQAAFAFYQGRFCLGKFSNPTKHSLDWSSSRVMSSIKNLMPDNCIVLRDGTRKEVVATELVPGDLLYIRLGDKLPADVRYVEASPDAKFDRSILTGEAEPLRGVVDSAEKNYASPNLSYKTAQY